MVIHRLSWYIRFIRGPFIVISVFLFSLELVSRLPQFTRFTLTLSTPLIWLVKAGGAFYVGYRIGEKEKKVMQSALGGGILGVGIGIISISISIFRRLTFLKPVLFGVFGGFDVFFVALSEIISAATFAAVGSVIAGGRLGEFES